MKKLSVLLLVFCMMLSAAVGVVHAEKIDDPLAGPAIDENTVVICTADETPSLTTAGHNAVAGDYVNHLTHNGLARLNMDLNPEPDLAESWEVEEDENGEETIWIFTLREGLKFCDGSDLKAEDVVASLLYAKEQPDAANYTQSFDTVEAIDDLQVKITTPGPSAALLYDLAHHCCFINPKKLIDEGADLNEQVVGAGPYKFVKWNRGESIEFTANEHYWDTERAPKIENVIWRIIKEGSSRTLAMQAGEVDFIIELDSASVDILEGNPNIVISIEPSVSHNWLCINNEKEPFDDINVRKAINCSINKQDVIDVALDGYGEIARGQTPEGMLGFSDKGMEEYDLDKAMEYMEAWGGDPASIELDIICSNDMKRRAAEVIQMNLADVGINATISSMDLATYLSKTADGDFTGFIGGYTSNEMMSFLKGVFLSDSIGAANKTRTNNPELDELIRESMRTVDQDEREKILIQASELLNELCPEIPLFQDNYLKALKANLDGFECTVGGTFWVQDWSWK
ncbi:MAG: ABC transporter substrate-binding protein [Eubacteriales bacterium]|nr:ABC transporter substrate-binding protein [Eubacteriales bacterium]